MSTLRIDNLSNVAGTQSTSILNAINGSAKAWVNFNGVGTIAIRSAYNVSSITDNGVGQYQVNFTTPMLDANYVVNTTSSVSAGNNAVLGSYVFANAATGARIAPLAANFSIAIQGANDTQDVLVTVFR